MAKQLFIAEKPSVAQEFARILKVQARRGDGYIESADTIVTWCVGHLVTMSYPEVYDEALKKWSLDTLPFLGSAVHLYQKYGFYEIESYNDSPVGSSIYMRLDL